MADATLLRVTDRIICVAESDVQLGVRYGVVDRNKTVVIRNGIDTASFEQRVARTSRNRIVIGTVGRLHIQKGHTILLHAVAKLAGTGKDISLRIVGEGELRQALEAEAKALKVDGVVEFRGSKESIAGELAEMDIFVLPSLWEGLPLALLEAMAAGVPIVATSVDGVCEVVTNGQEALLVPPSDPDSLAGAIFRMLQDKGLAERLAANALTRVRREFSVDRMIEQTESVYEDLMRGDS